MVGVQTGGLFGPVDAAVAVAGGGFHYGIDT